MSGSEMQREKEKVAAKMREKQAAGNSLATAFYIVYRTNSFEADARRAAEGGGKK